MEASLSAALQPERLGHEDALAAACVARENGAPLLALQYLLRAISLRRTQYALVQLGSLQRDLGLGDDARQSYRAALALPGSSRVFALVGLAAVLCDACEFEDALLSAREAIELDPDNPPALMTAARALEEVVQTSDPGTDAGYRDALRQQASAFRARARELEPTTASERLRARRDRALPLHLIIPPSTSTVALDQTIGELAIEAPDTAITKETPVTHEAASIDRRASGRLRRFLDRISGRTRRES